VQTAHEAVVGLMSYGLRRYLVSSSPDCLPNSQAIARATCGYFLTFIIKSPIRALWHSLDAFGALCLINTINALAFSGMLVRSQKHSGNIKSLSPKPNPASVKTFTASLSGRTEALQISLWNARDSQARRPIILSLISPQSQSNNKTVATIPIHPKISHNTDIHHLLPASAGDAHG